MDYLQEHIPVERVSRPQMMLLVRECFPLLMLKFQSENTYRGKKGNRCWCLPESVLKKLIATCCAKDDRSTVAIRKGGRDELCDHPLSSNAFAFNLDRADTNLATLSTFLSNFEAQLLKGEGLERLRESLTELRGYVVRLRGVRRPEARQGQGHEALLRCTIKLLSKLSPKPVDTRLMRTSLGSSRSTTRSPAPSCATWCACWGDWRAPRTPPRLQLDGEAVRAAHRRQAARARARRACIGAVVCGQAQHAVDAVCAGAGDAESEPTARGTYSPRYNTSCLPNDWVCRRLL